MLMWPDFINWNRMKEQKQKNMEKSWSTHLKGFCDLTMISQSLIILLGYLTCAKYQKYINLI